jgi:hypothetical protein
LVWSRVLIGVVFSLAAEAKLLLARVIGLLVNVGLEGHEKTGEVPAGRLVRELLIA